MDSIGWADVVFAVVALLVMGAVIAVVSDRVHLLGDADGGGGDGHADGADADQQVPNATM